MSKTYHMNEGSFALPAGLKDRTVHMFALTDNGPSEFTLIVTRASGVEEVTIDAFARRLLTELRKGLPKFELKSQTPRTVGGCPAIDLYYMWRSEEQLLHQRQVVLLTRGMEESQRNALQIIATS